MKTLVIDFGLVVLIWMTQLVVYPSFAYFPEASLLLWHPQYTSAITVIVMPLMLAQVTIHGLGIVRNFNWLRLTAIILISLAWVNTFLYAVPLHEQIASGINVQATVHSLIAVNWYRTLLWSLVFVISIFDWSKNQVPAH
jgi:hypothetical protein